MTMVELSKAFTSQEALLMPSRVLTLHWYLSSQLCAGMFGCPVSELTDDKPEQKPKMVREFPSSPKHLNTATAVTAS